MQVTIVILSSRSQDLIHIAAVSPLTGYLARVGTKEGVGWRVVWMTVGSLWVIWKRPGWASSSSCPASASPWPSAAQI